jgi:hypothetical protein
LRARYLSTAGLILALSMGLPAASAGAQMSFQGLDLNEKPKPAKPPKKHKAPPPVAAPVPVPPKAPPPATLPGLDLTGNAPPAPPPPPLTPAALAMPALTVGGKGVDPKRMEAIAQQLKDGYQVEAALAAYDAVKDATTQAQAAEAEYLLAKSLYRMKLYHSALHHFSRVLARGPDGAYFGRSLEWLFFISRRTVDEGIVLEDVARYSGTEFPVRYRSEFRYLLARYHLTRAEALIQAGQTAEGKASLAEARQLVEMVPSTAQYFPRARFLAGTAAYQEAEIGLPPGQPAAPEALAPALEDFKEVVRVTNPRAPNAFHDFHTRELAFMNLARIHYEARQNRAAIYYYGKVARGGEQWLESLYETAWAYYRLGDYERALGNMITLHAPFFKDEYFPESLTVKAIIYYENCRYAEVRRVIDEFERIYGPVQAQLEKIVAKEQPPKAFYQLLDDIQKKQRQQSSDPLLDRILKVALSDENFKLRNAVILEIQTESDAVTSYPEAFRYSSLAKSLLDEMQKDRAAAIEQAGQLARAKLEQERDELRELLSKALRIKFETQDKEKELLEQKLVDQRGKPEGLHRYRYSVAVPDSEEYWPYEGEYWRDELGTYQYTLTRGCRTSLSAEH